jgi:hypothetical protein
MTRFRALRRWPTLTLGPILTLAAALAACAPPIGYTNPDVKAGYAIGNHLFDVRAVQAGSGYDVYVAELGGPYLSDFVLLDTDTHVEAAELVLGDRCRNPSLAGDWLTFGFDGIPQPSLGIIARFNCT